jgi:hypothetical protein
MNVLHVSQNSNGYELVELVANKVSRNNSMKLIRVDGMEFMTGGFILNDTKVIRNLLDSHPKESHYKLVKEIKLDPFVKLYADED